MKIKLFFSILIGKIFIFLGSLIKRGSSLGGLVVLKLNKNILKQLTLPKTIICVTGSSGKGETARIITNVYLDFGYTVSFNNKGSNQISGIVTSLIKNSNFKGKVKTDIGVFEVDERYAKYIFPYLKPNYVLITNITKDQPPRQKHVDFVFEEIKKALDSKTTLILNGDDPYLQKFNLDNNYNTIYYGIDKLKYSFKENKFNSLNIYRCPKCLATLKYSFYHIEQLGKYSCPKCDFKTPNEKYSITHCNYFNNKIKINKTFEITLNNNMLYNLYDVLGSFSLLSENNLDKTEICKSISKINLNKKLFKELKYNKRKVYILNNKAENATTYNQSLLFVNRDKETKTIVLGWKEISRRYKFNDISWLYDIDFELLNDGKIDRIICAGPQKYDIATRLKYANIDEKKIKVFYDLYDAKEEIEKSKGTIYAILNFDYVKPFNEIMEEIK